jgi:hypothetical protein
MSALLLREFERILYTRGYTLNSPSLPQGKVSVKLFVHPNVNHESMYFLGTL